MSAQPHVLLYTAALALLLVNLKPADSELCQQQG
jgi:hypothetical protein